MIPPADGVYFSTPGVASVTWDEGGQFVLVEWDGWANSVEFASLLAAELSALEQHKGSRILADCRRQKVLNPQDQDRANREWLPRALKIGLRRFAIVVPASVVADMNLRDSLQKASAAGLEVEYFATVEEAREWLMS
jgi:predicted TIM-barrel fold metal-dependent hydrolase